MKLMSNKRLGSLIWVVVSALCSTLRIEVHGPGKRLFRECGVSFVYAIWHGRMTIPLYTHRDCGVSIIISEHADGEIVTTTVLKSGNMAIRGSTTRGGVRALAQMVRHLKSGGRACFTPDGPRGPKWKLQPGIIYAAAKSGAPILPITGSARHAITFKSWDRFQLPLPFSKAVVNIGEFYHVTGGMDDDNIERHRAEVERILVELTREADRIAGREPEQ